VSFPLLVLADAARSLVLAGLAVAIALPLVRSLATLPERRRSWMWALLLVPFLLPALLVSYAYAPLALRAMAVPAGLPLLHFFALFLRLVPVAVIALHFVPPLASAEARHCHALLAPTVGERRLFLFRSAASGLWLAGGLVFLLAFADFELASLWNVKTWTVALFDAHAGGLALRESLRLAAWPLALQLLVLLALSRLIGSTAEGAWAPSPPRTSRASNAYFASAAIVVGLLPLAIIGAQALTGLSTLVENFTLARELTASLAVALGAAVCASAAGHATLRRASVAAWLSGAPGLLGALVLALLLVALFNLPLFRPAYDTPLPLLLALTLLLLPLALLLRWRLAATEPNPALHVARLSKAPSVRLLWRLDGRRRFACFALLFYWAYGEFTASSILAPVGLTPVFARLHNLAHYGQTEVLSAMLLAAFLAPVTLLLLTAPIARFYPRRDGR
jgi:ABC-type Fe3+ transport system permease subunit